MTDPLSVTAGVAGLLSLAAQLVEIGTKYKYSSNSPIAQGRDFIAELQALLDVLTRLKDFLQGPDISPTFDRISALLWTNRRCEAKLQEILQKLQKTMQESSRFKKAVDRLMWPLAVKEHREAIEDVHRYAEVFEFALSIEGCALLAKTTTETATALKEQMRKLKETKALCKDIPNVSTQIEASLSRLSRVQALIEALPDVSSDLATISQGLSRLKDAAVIQEYCYNERERRETLKWLSPIAYEAKQRQLFERHQRGTGAWLTSHELFQQWKTTRGSKLWCSGKPGAGKTSMASLVVNTLRECHHSSIPTTFVYADFKERHQQNQHHILSAISRQLASQNAAVMDDAFSRYRKHKEHCQGVDVAPLNFTEHVELLQNASAHIDRMFIVIDAVDEIPSTVETQGADVRFELLHALTGLGYVSLFCTSRPQIEASLYSADFSTLAIEATDNDLRTFLETRMSLSRRLLGLLQKEPSLEEEIIQTITQKASGVFLLARFQIEEVKAAISIRQVRSILGKLSSKYKDMYETTLERVKSQTDVETRLGLRAISWVASILRPLTVSEFVHALSMELNDDALDSSSLIDIHIILESCAGLLQLQRESLDSCGDSRPFQSEDTVKLVHYTLQEYLDASTPMTAIHSDIANTSLSYLCFKEFRTSLLYHINWEHRYPFLAYAAHFWPLHAEAAGDALRKDLVEMLISPKHPEVGRNWLGLALPRRYHFTRNFDYPLGFAAAVVAIHGAFNVLELMLSLELPVNARFDDDTPFSRALSKAPWHCMELIFAGGLTSNVAMNRSWSLAALESCHVYTHMDLFTTLLEKHLECIKMSDHADAKQIMDGPFSETLEMPLLNAAVWYREIEVVKILTQAGWNVNMAYKVPGHTHKKYKYSTALHDAVQVKSEEIVQLIVDVGYDVNGPYPHDLLRALFEALKLNRPSLLQILTDAGAKFPRLLPAYLEVPIIKDSDWRSSWSRILEELKRREGNESHGGGVTSS